jgi:hypothetical protein
MASDVQKKNLPILTASEKRRQYRQKKIEEAIARDIDHPSSTIFVEKTDFDNKRIKKNEYLRLYRQNKLDKALSSDNVSSVSVLREKINLQQRLRRQKKKEQSSLSTPIEIEIENVESSIRMEINFEDVVDMELFDEFLKPFDENQEKFDKIDKTVQLLIENDPEIRSPLVRQVDRSNRDQSDRNRNRLIRFEGTDGWDYETPCVKCNYVFLKTTPKRARHICCLDGLAYEYLQLQPLPPVLNRIANKMPNHIDKNCVFYNNILKIGCTSVQNNRGHRFFSSWHLLFDCKRQQQLFGDNKHNNRFTNTTGRNKCNHECQLFWRKQRSD